MGLKTECSCPDQHDEMYECRMCGNCCFDEMTLAEPNDSYEDKGICVQCALNEGLTISELVAIANK